MNLLGFEPTIALKYRGKARRHLLATLQTLSVLRGGNDVDPAVDDILYLLDRPHDLPWEIEPEQRAYKYEVRCGLTPGDNWCVQVNDVWEPLGMAVMSTSLLRHWGYEPSGYVRLRNALDSFKQALQVDLEPVAPGHAPRVALVLAEPVVGKGLGLLSQIAPRLQGALPHLDWPGEIGSEVRLHALRVQMAQNGKVGLDLEFSDPSADTLAHPLLPHFELPNDWLTSQVEPSSDTVRWQLELAAPAGSHGRVSVRLFEPGTFHLDGDSEPQGAWQRLFELARASGYKEELETLCASFKDAGISAAPRRLSWASGGKSPQSQFVTYGLLAQQ